MTHNFQDKRELMQESQFQVGIKARVFNYSLHRALERTGKTRAEIAGEIGISPGTLQHWLAFKSYPRESLALKVSIYLRESVEVLFPDEIKGVRIKKQPEIQAFSLEDFRSALTGEQPQYMLEDGNLGLSEAIQDVLTSLSERENRIMTRYFGLDGDGGRTYKEVAQEEGVTPERIRQIVGKGLRKLRHPSKSFKLRDYVEVR